jgi:NTE family protein
VVVVPATQKSASVAEVTAITFAVRKAMPGIKDAGAPAPAYLLAERDGDRLSLAGGETLFSQGDPPDCLYVVVHGRLEVSVRRDDGEQEVIAHIGRGDSIGETELLTGEPRSVTVRATRDTELLRLPQDQFELLLNRHPRCVRQIAKTFMTRSSPKARVSTVALVPAQKDGLPTGFVESLTRELSTLAGTAVHLTSGRIGHDPEERLAEFEDKFSYVLMECDPRLSSWTEFCVRHADLILIVAPAQADPRLGEIEAAIFAGPWSTCSGRRELVLVHSDTAGMPSGTSRWLTVRRVAAHHHVRHGHARDYQRLARFITDKAVGVVLSGGGARGLAHIGALQALEHCGVPIDFIGGTSIGSAVAAQWAMGTDVSALIGIGTSFCRNFGRHFVRDITFPMVAVNSARRFAKYLEDLFGEIRVEDLWLPYFCTSSNLSNAQVAVHDEGLLWTWIRASSSIPGIWPPVVRDGHMLVDGGVMNNLPVDVMRKRCRGPVIGIDVSPGFELPVRSGPHTELSGWRLLWKSLNPFAQKTELPHIFSILRRTAQMGSICGAETIKRQADLCLQPPTVQIDSFDWKSGDKLIDVAYQYCVKEIEEWKNGVDETRTRDLLRDRQAF